MTIKILLADDHKIIREGLRSLIEKMEGMEVTAEADNGRTAVHLAEKLAPDIAILDIGMPGLNGIDAARRIVSAAPGVKVIALSMHADRRFIIGMLKAGASAYLLKDCAFEELVQAIRSVIAKRIYLSPPLANTIFRDYLRRVPERACSPYTLLSQRERDVLQLIAEGKATKQIASELNVSVKTVETHRQQLLDKVGVCSIAELTKYAIREGLTTLER